jgi:hypothetical protein
MRWISNLEDGLRTLADARERAARDACGSAGSGLVRLSFDEMEVMNGSFFVLPRRLIELSDDPSFRFVILDPDPVKDFFVHFGKYSILEFSDTDSEDGYIASLNEDPGGHRAGALIYYWYEYVFLPPSKKWFIHGARSEQSGIGAHLFAPPDWVSELKLVKPNLCTDDELLD